MEQTKIDSSILTSEILPPNYSVMRKDRNKDGGGFMIALKGDLVASHRPDLDADADILWAQLEIVGSKPLLIGVFYRSQVTELHEMDYLM